MSNRNTVEDGKVVVALEPREAQLLARALVDQPWASGKRSREIEALAAAASSNVDPDDLTDDPDGDTAESITDLYPGMPVDERTGRPDVANYGDPDKIQAIELDVDALEGNVAPDGTVLRDENRGTRRATRDDEDDNNDAARAGTSDEEQQAAAERERQANEQRSADVTDPRGQRVAEAERARAQRRK